MTLATRNLWLGIGAVLLLTLAAAAVTVHQADRRARRRRIGAIAAWPVRWNANCEASRLAELQLRADSLAQDPAFVDYVAQSLIPVPQLGGAIDKASISDLLKERRHGYDVAMVLDTQGAPIAAVRCPAEGPRRHPGRSAGRPGGQPSAVAPGHAGSITASCCGWRQSAAARRCAAGCAAGRPRIDDAFAMRSAGSPRADVALLATACRRRRRLRRLVWQSWIGQELSRSFPQLLRVTAEQARSCN